MHPVGAGLRSARCSDEISTRGRSRAPPLQGPRKKVTSIWISNAPSIDGSRSKATSCKPDTSVSGGAYQDARKVSLVWNDIQNIDACLNSEAERTKRVQALFSPPHLFSCERKDGAVGDMRQLQICSNLSGAARQLPWKGSL